MIKKTHGWIIENTQDHCFVKDCEDVKNLKQAEVYLTRAKAREQRWRLTFDIIRKVALDCGGRAVAIIPGR